MQLSKRIRDLQSGAKKAGKAPTTAAAGNDTLQPTPVCVMLPHQTREAAGHLKSRRTRSKLPDPPPKTVNVGKNSIDFTPTDCDLMNLVEEPTPPTNQNHVNTNASEANLPGMHYNPILQPIHLVYLTFSYFLTFFHLFICLPNRSRVAMGICMGSGWFN